MSVIFSATHNANNWNEWTSQSGADISLSAGAALCNSAYGISVLIDDTTADYTTKTGLNDTSGKLSWRFYFDPNTASISSGGVSSIGNIYNSVGDSLAVIRLKHNGTNYQIGGYMYNDAGGTHAFANYYTITDAPHCIEIRLIKASSAIASDATYELIIDNISKETLTGKDLYDRWTNVGILRIGERSIDSGTITGTLFFDEVVANNDGGTIGPYYILIVAGLAQEQSVENIDLTQHQALEVSTLAQPQLIGSPGLSQHQVLGMANLVQAQTVTSILLTQHQNLAAQNLAQAQSIDAPALIQHQALIAANALQSQAVDNISLTQNQVLAVDDILQTQTLESLTLTADVGAITLLVADLIQEQAGDDIALVQHQILTIGFILQSQAVDNADLVQNQVLAVQDLIQAQVMGAAALVQHHALAVDDLSQTQSIATPTLTIHAPFLAVQGMIQAQIIDNFELIQHFVLSVEDALQLQVLAIALLIVRPIGPGPCPTYQPDAISTRQAHERGNNPSNSRTTNEAWPRQANPAEERD
jgi:hypothetical protein